ncbi:MAG: hypothetical protein AB7O98_08155 [Hyphomonadaceae bacterium]
MKRHLLAVACAFGCAGFAHAEPGGTSTVYGPSVAQGEAEFEYRGATFTGGALDGDAAHRFEAGYGVTDWWRPALVIQVEDSSGGGAEVSDIAVENVFDFAGTRDWPVHFGGYVEYAFGQNGHDDEVELKLLAERRGDAVTTRLNLIGEHEIDGDEWEFGYAARVSWRASDHWALDIEGFGEPDANVHYWGPRVSFSLGETSLALGYLAGLDDAAADGQIRLALEFES